MLSIILFEVESIYYDISTDKKTLYINATDSENYVTQTGVAGKAPAETLLYVIINEGIIEVKKASFMSYSNIISIKLPKGLKYLRDSCFQGCSSLKSIILPEGLLEVSNHAFYECTSLENITIPSTLKKIGNTHTFFSCSSLSKFSIPKQNSKYSTDSSGRILIEDGVNAIFGTAKFENVTIPDQIQKIKTFFLNRFPNVNVKTIIFGKNGSLKEIEVQAFRYTGIKSITYPEGLEKIGNIVLEGNEVDFISVPSTLKTHSGIFNPVPKSVKIADGCICLKMDSSGIVYNGDKTAIQLLPMNLTEITINGTIKSISTSALLACKNLTKFNVSDTNPDISSHDNVLYSKNYSILIAAPGCIKEHSVHKKCEILDEGAMRGVHLKYLNFSGSSVWMIKKSVLNHAILDQPLILPEGLTHVESWSFSGFIAPSIQFPSSLKNISKEIMTNASIPELNLSMCTNLERITQSCFQNSKFSVLILPNINIISPNAFFGCENLTSVTIPATVSELGVECFKGCKSLSVLNFSLTSISKIPQRAFMDCNLTALFVPDSVTTIEQDAFALNPFLTDVTFTNNSNLTTLQMGVFRECPLITKLSFGAKLTNFPGGALYWMDNLCYINFSKNNQNYSSEDGIVYSKNFDMLVAFPPGRKVYVIHPNVKVFGASAFYRRRMLETISYTGSLNLTEIKSQTFYECERFKSISVPASVKTIESEAFKGCTQLKNATFEGKSLVEKLASLTFEGCKNIEKIVFSDESHLNEIQNGVFAGLDSLKTFVAPPSLRTIGDEAFKGCRLLANFDFSHITVIGKLAFSGCSGLEIVNFNKNLSTLGQLCFRDCNRLRTVVYCGYEKFDVEAFGTTKIFAYVPTKYDSNKFCDLPTLKVLEENCLVPTFIFSDKIMERKSTTRSVFGFMIVSIGGFIDYPRNRFD